MFDLLPHQMQPAVLPVPEVQPDIVYVGGSQMPDPPKPQPILSEVANMTGSQAPNPPQPPAK